MFTFTVTLDGEVDTAVDVSHSTADGTASTGDGDYATEAGSLTFAPASGNLQTQAISVTVRGDEKVELDESFFVNLFNAAALGRNVSIADSQGLGTILNDDSATVAIDDISQSEGSVGDTIFTFTVTLDAEVDVPVDFDWDTADGTATGADSDYAAVVGAASGFAANIGPGSQTQAISVTVAGDTKVEQDEAFRVLLSGLRAAGRDV